MFVCEPCAKKTGWPYYLAVSFGPCELCGRDNNCDNVKPRRPANPGSLDQIRKERDERRAEKR